MSPEAGWLALQGWMPGMRRDDAHTRLFGPSYYDGTALMTPVITAYHTPSSGQRWVQLHRFHAVDVQGWPRVTWDEVPGATWQMFIDYLQKD